MGVVGAIPDNFASQWYSWRLRESEDDYEMSEELRKKYSRLCRVETMQSIAYESRGHLNKEYDHVTCDHIFPKSEELQKV